MIVFVPAYDISTQANLTLAQQLSIPSKSINLLGKNATRDALLKALEDGERVVFAMSHGESNTLFAQNGQIALSTDNAHLLGGGIVYAFACHTAAQLGKSAAETGSIWWGYAGWISCAIDSPSVQSIFIEIFSFIRDNFPLATSTEARQIFLDRLKQECEKATDKIIEIHEKTANPDFELFQVMSTLHHLWDRLRIWVPDAANSERHEDASPDVLPWG